MAVGMERSGLDVRDINETELTKPGDQLDAGDEEEG